MRDLELRIHRLEQRLRTRREDQFFETPWGALPILTDEEARARGLTRPMDSVVFLRAFAFLEEQGHLPPDPGPQYVAPRFLEWLQRTLQELDTADPAS